MTQRARTGSNVEDKTMSDRFHCYCPCGSCEDLSHCYRGECDAPRPNLEVVIAEAVANFIAGDDREWVDEYEPAQRDEFVASIPRLLAALKANGIEVVERDRLTQMIKACNENAENAAEDKSAHCEEMFYRGQAVAYSVVVDGTLEDYEQVIAGTADAAESSHE
ncbi:hypothetical protein A5742_16385 [Mycolicibacterium fortuitum]|uniref:Uncharacterized protein n=1 Tax=Mycolicibacterium fortuitum TaxID=1766 RepID=A0ABD6QTR7_MYCFO|nr:hypothetical protein [Mycolicibacterium fortuitum]OMC52527.1 hypothetical protein A5742_16385 [Mycolicibacterium fortuitum]